MAKAIKPRSTGRISLDAPDEKYLLALQKELEALYGPQDKDVDDIREVREFRRAVKLEDKYRLTDVEIRDAAVADEIFRVVASHSINPAKMTFKPSRESDKANLNSTLREKITMAIFETAGSRLPGMSTLAGSVDSNFGDGACWTKFLLDQDIWDLRYSLTREDFEEEIEEPDPDAEPDEESQRPTRKVKRINDTKYNEATEDAKKHAGPPFVWQSVDVKCVLPVWQGAKLGEVLEVQQRPMSSTFRKYRLGLDKAGDIVPEELGQGSAPSDKSITAAKNVKWLEHWDNEYATYMVVGANYAGKPTGLIVQQWRHRYKRPPYFYGLGLMMSHWKNRKVGWSISHTKRYLTEYKSYLRTLHANVALRDAMPPVSRETAPGAVVTQGNDKKPKGGERYLPGQIYDNPPGTTLKPMTFPMVSQNLRDELQQVDTDIERLQPARLKGPIGDLSGAGFALNTALTEEKIRYEPNANNIEKMLCELTWFCWYLIRDVLQEEVWVREGQSGDHYLHAGPDDLTATGTVLWELSPERPSDLLIKARYWHERLQAGTCGLQEAIEGMGDNFDEINRSRARDQIRLTPEYQRMLKEEVLFEAGRGDLLTMANDIAQTGMIPPEGGAPTMGNAGQPPDMAALAMAPNAAGVAPVNAPNQGTSPGAVVPAAGATAGIQRLSVGQ